MFQQPISATQLAQFSRVAGAFAGFGALVDVGLVHPFVQGHRMDTEIGGDLLDRHTGFAVASDADHVVTELLGVRPGHKDILPACPRRASQLRCHLFMQQTRILTPLLVSRDWNSLINTRIGP